MSYIEILSLFGIPAAVTGVIVGFFWRWYNKKEAARDAKEKNRESLELCIIKSIEANTALAKATAEAVQRIPDAKCNGDMTKALDYAKKVKTEQREFLNTLGVHALYDD